MRRYGLHDDEWDRIKDLLPGRLGHVGVIAGNTVVLKPSFYTPLTVLRVAELVRDILPAGILNVVTGGDNVGPWMTSHPEADKISFTGSTQTGRRVFESASP